MKNESEQNISEIGLANDHSVFLPPKQMFNNEFTEPLPGPVEDSISRLGIHLPLKPSQRGNCYRDCFNEAPEITIHSILGIGSPNVEQMKVLKFKNDKLTQPCDNCKRTQFRWDQWCESRFFNNDRAENIFWTVLVMHLSITKNMFPIDINHSKWYDQQE